MTCKKAFEIDLAAFLVDASGPAFAEFREHYPRCEICSAEVQAWTEIHAQLEAGAARAESSHPAEELLLRFEEQPSALSAEQKQSIERHLATCRSCRDELGALRSFDFAALEGGASPAGRRWWQTIADLGSLLRGVALHPAFAYGLVLLLLLPTVIARLPNPVSRPAAFQDLIREPALTPEDTRSALSVGELAASRHSALQPSGRLKEELQSADELIGIGPPAEPETTDAEIVRMLKERHEGRTYHLQVPSVVGRQDLRQSHSDARAGNAPEGEMPRKPAAPLAVLDPDKLVEISAAGIGEAVILRIALPEEAGTSGDMEVRILSPSGRSELQERFSPPAGTRHLDMRVPTAWLSPGRYRVEIRASGAPLSRPPLMDLAFVVRR